MSSFIDIFSYKSIVNNLKLNDPRETEQALKLRVPIGVAILAHLFSPWYSDGNFLEKLMAPESVVVSIWFILGLLLAANIIIRPGYFEWRRYAAIVLDMVSLSAAMYFGHAGTMYLFVLYPWVILGNGFRYGVKFLFFTQAIGLTGFIFAASFGEHLKSNTEMAIAFGIVIIALPLYFSHLITTLYKAVDAAKSANRAKSQFIANMSHELRTPLNGMIGMVDVLKFMKLSPEQLQVADNIKKSGNVLLELIQQVLDISKIEAGKLKIKKEEFDVYQTVTKVFNVVSYIAQDKGLYATYNISGKTPVNIVGSQIHLQEILLNLVSNAIKFTDSGTVSIRVFPVERENKKYVRFEIIDTGIGIEDDDIEDIFDAFTQVESGKSRKYGGTGLGTTISKRLAELLDGEIGCESQIEVGSIFWVEIPYLEEKKATGINGLNILIISPDHMNALPPDYDLCADCNILRFEDPYQYIRDSNSERKEHLLDVVLIDAHVIPGFSLEQISGLFKSVPAVRSTPQVLFNAPENNNRADDYTDYFISVIHGCPDPKILENAIYAGWLKSSQMGQYDNDITNYTFNKELNIFIAEDNRINREVLERLLVSVGHKVTTAVDGDDALKQLSESLCEYDILILDLNMPFFSGTDVIKAVRFMEGGEDIPVIILSADATPGTIEYCIKCGASKYITKPIQSLDLLKAISELSNSIVSMDPTRTVSNMPFDPHIDPIKLGGLLKLGGKDFLDKTVKNFHDDFSTLYGELDEVFSTDYPRLKEIIHSIKGISLEVGAKKIITLCKAIGETKPHQLMDRRLVLLVHDLQAEFEETHRRLIEFAEKAE